MIDLKNVSACLITKEPLYPREILEQLTQFPFGEILILTNSDSPIRKQDLFTKAKHDLIYYQDDDAICPIADLVNLSNPEMINVAMKPGHFEAYAHTRMTMGLGWGSIFPKKLLESLKRYTDVYGEDALYQREDGRIFTYLNYPQNRLVLPIQDLPSAIAPDRLWRQPIHQPNMGLVENRCASLLKMV